ncbi:C6 zinc finger domain protein [Apiospora saccharicola]
MSLCRVLEMRWLVSDIWVDSRLFPNETIYDAYRGQFERILSMATDEAHSRESLGASDTRKFRFESKLAPQLHFAVLKCRFLPERLQFLALFKKLAYQREALWDAVQLEEIGRLAIEREHGIELASESIDSLLATPMGALTVPSEGRRIMDYFVDGETETRTLPSGSKVSRRSICFTYRPDRQGPVVDVKDWIILQRQPS